jgi:conjugative relaxase-like TrwC/TraI family protein
VLSIGKLTVEQSRYYEHQVAQGRDDYYSGRGESPGRWAGGGAETLRLGGRVDDDGFMALMDGRDPGTGEGLKRVGGRSKVAAFDLTFSAPKSVSVLFAIGEPALAGALVEAHESAVDAALGYLEREACRVRRGRGGVEREVGEGFVAAAYRHRMSRAEDPQLHTHVVAANLARGADGRWTALDATPIYQHAKAAGFLYQAHLRAAVRERLPWVRWGPVRNGMAEIKHIAPAVLWEFSTRRRQIEERERELAAAGVQVGDGGREAIAHATRARKRYGIDTAPWRDVVPRGRPSTDSARASSRRWCVDRRGLPRLRIRRANAELAGASGLTEKQNTFARREAVMAWAAAHGQGAPARAVELAAAAFLTRADVHHATDPSGRRFTTSDLLAHEQAIVAGAQVRRGEGAGRLDSGLVDAVLANAPFVPTAEQARVIRGLTSSGHGVETVEALAGTGKTFTAGLLAQAYTAGGFRVLGTAPTGRAVRELTEQAGIGHAWTLTRLALDLDADRGGFGTGPVVLIVDEAGMASTRETARVMAHAQTQGVKVIAIGDSGQLSSVQAGGWLGSLTRRLGSYELREVMRQRDPREHQLLARVRRGDPTDYTAEKGARVHLHIYAGDAQGPGGGDHAAVSAWRERQSGCPWGQAVLIVRDNQRRERINALVRAELRRDGRLGESVQVAGREFAVGDRVVARRNDRERAVDNGMRATVIAVDPTEKDVLVRTDAGAQRRLDASYVAEHLQHAYALTAHTIQGATVEWAGVVGRPEDFTRNWSYTALSRAREPTELFLVDTQTERELDRAEIAPRQTRGLGDERTLIERLETAMGCRDDEDLALDRIDAERTRGTATPEPAGAGLSAEATIAPPPVVELQAELMQLRERIGVYPEHLVDQLHAARTTRAEAQRVAGSTRVRIAQLDQPAAGKLGRRRPADSAEVALERQRLKLAEEEIAAAAGRERDLADRLPDRAEWDAERRVLRERAAELDAQLSSRRREHLRAVLERPAPYLEAALGVLPDQPRARRTWQQAATRIEAYRFDHAVTDARHALGSPPSDTRERAQWQRARHDLQRAQRDLSHRIDRQHSHEV